VRLITRADDDMYQAANLADKLGRAAALVDQLVERYEENWQDPEVSFQYALVLMATLQNVRSDVEGHRRYSATMEALGEVLVAEPDHWLARYCRARLRALVPAGFGGYTMFVDHERTMANADLTELADRQSRVPWQPYFACTHLLQAFVAGQSEDWAAVRRCIDAAAQRPHGPVGPHALGAILCEPFVALYPLVDGDQRAVVGRLMATMFPDLPVVATALTEPVR